MSIALATRGIICGRSSMSMATRGVICIFISIPIVFIPTFIVPTPPIIKSDLFNKSSPVFFDPVAVVLGNQDKNIINKSDVLLAKAAAVVASNKQSAAIANKQDADIYNKDIDIYNKDSDVFNKEEADIYNKQSAEPLDPNKC